MPAESSLVYYLIIALCGVFILLCAGGYWLLHHHDHIQEERTRAKLVAERLEQIASIQTNTIQRRHTVTMDRQTFNEMQE
jgi:flagellar basal body-associated protein FliL